MNDKIIKELKDQLLIKEAKLQALQRYVQHKFDCLSLGGGDCTCGLAILTQRAAGQE